MMGDGSINFGGSNNPSIQCASINEEYLQYLHDEFGVLSTEPIKSSTSKELAEANRHSGFDPSASASSYSDQYYWKTVSHPDLSTFASWYDNGQKTWPKDIVLSPTVLKHWYCGDGHHNTYNRSRIEISMNNEASNEEKVKSYFREFTPTVPRINTRERKSGKVACKLTFTEPQSNKIWEYMGEPLPGFEYKWPERFK